MPTEASRKTLSGRVAYGVCAVTIALGMMLPLLQAAEAHGFNIASIRLDHPWARATPAEAKVAAGYVVIRNTGRAADRLVAATAEIAGRVEIHEMAAKDGVMTMRALANGLAIPARSEVALKPASFHLMFLDLKRPLKQGETFKGTLTFEKAGTVTVTFNVEAIGAAHGSH